MRGTRRDVSRFVAARGGERGMSLVEALIAMALLLLVAIGILPLFTRAMVNNAAGNEATAVANHARHRLEELGQLPFDNIALTPDDGSELLGRDVYFSGDFLAQGDEVWDAAGDGVGAQLRDRTTRVRQFQLVDPPGAMDENADGIIENLGGLLDGDENGEFDSPLAAGSDPSTHNLKEVSVELVNPRDDLDNPGATGPMGMAPAYRVRSLRTF